MWIYLFLKFLLVLILNFLYPFLAGLSKRRKNGSLYKFLKIFNQLHINIPFFDATVQIPSYARFLKDIISKKRKLVDNEVIALTKECNAVIQN